MAPKFINVAGVTKGAGRRNGQAASKNVRSGQAKNTTKANAASLILPIDHKHRLAADRYGWRVEQYKPRQRQGKQWIPILWYSTLESAVNGLVHLRLRTCGAQTLQDALVELERVSARLSTALHPHFTVETQS
jgi:hypothetical protein